MQPHHGKCNAVTFMPPNHALKHHIVILQMCTFSSYWYQHVKYNNNVALTYFSQTLSSVVEFHQRRQRYDRLQLHTYLRFTT